jgi:DNA-binding MarR family transcriptional regulator
MTNDGSLRAQDGSLRAQDGSLGVQDGSRNEDPAGQAPHDDAEELAAALRVSMGLLVRRLKQVVLSGDLAMPGTSVLSRLDRGGPMTSSELARLDRVSPQSMGATVAALERDGLITRDRDPDDGRRIIVSITRAGRQVVHSRRDERTRQIAQALRVALTPSELAQVRAVVPLLERLAEKL